MNFTNTYTKQQWIAEQARRHPERVFTTLHRQVDMEWMRESWRKTRKDGAVGIDGVTAREYAANLEANLQDLMSRMKSGRYQAPPVRRHYLSKADGGKRPLGIPTLEDKVAQRAVLMLLEPIYEQDFRPCSHGFRPGRSAHDGLDSLRGGIVKQKLHWVIDADISGYFDSIDPGHLRGFLDLRIKDGVVRRLLDKWLKAGVLEAEVLSRPKTGTPQGGVISPLLSNIYLHHVLDKWFEEEVVPRVSGRCQLVRYADDFVMCFSTQHSGERVMRVLGKRLGRYGLKLHERKTHYVDFRAGQGKGVGAVTSFDFLGFTHVWGRSRRGKWVLRRFTAKDRLARAISSVNAWCRKYRHLPMTKQQAHLARVIRGHCNYYGVTGNFDRLQAFRYWITRIWKKWLSRRSWRGGSNWEWMNRILLRYPLPRARVVHSVYST
ncbi:MAG: group II intron reverse transcriptase/maturase [Gammaproteobacteria bacterium]|nr:group II intron reverse transcriptase/maturase [Gammaproteobacteria bacterium]